LVSSCCHSQSFIQGESTGFSIGEPVIVDINVDNKLDVVSLEKFGFGTVGDLILYVNNSEVGANEFDSIDLGVRGIGAPSAADLDGDGDLDIIVSQWNGTTAIVIGLFNESQLNFRIDTLSVENFYRHRLADLDNDDDMDLVSFNSDNNTLAIYFNDGNGTFNKVYYFNESDLYQAELADLDKDGDVDIILGFNNFFGNEFLQLEYNGDGSFSEKEIAQS